VKSGLELEGWACMALRLLLTGCGQHASTALISRSDGTGSAAFSRAPQHPI
jgi:hypothetical protein